MVLGCSLRLGIQLGSQERRERESVTDSGLRQQILDRQHCDLFLLRCLPPHSLAQPSHKLVAITPSHKTIQPPPTSHLPLTNIPRPILPQLPPPRSLLLTQIRLTQLHLSLAFDRAQHLPRSFKHMHTSPIAQLDAPDTLDYRLATLHRGEGEDRARARGDEVREGGMGEKEVETGGEESVG